VKAEVEWQESLCKKKLEEYLNEGGRQKVLQDEMASVSVLDVR
jgi:hypothetical protein